MNSKFEKCAYSKVGAFLQGVLISFLPVFLMPVLGDLGFTYATVSDSEFGVSSIILGSLANCGGIKYITV